MAMTKTELAFSAWTEILAAPATDMLVVISGGSARLCTGPASATTDLGFDVSDGYQAIIPAGVALHGVSVGAPAVAVSGPFGV